jgi:hypothetical protein
MTADVPRLDYLGSSCPSLLLEPQRTNFALYSEQFDNAAWTKANATITANSILSPDGYQNADTITSVSYPSTSVNRSFSATASSHTLSCFAKAGTISSFRLDFVTSGFALGSSAIFNLSTLSTTITNFGATTGSTASIVNYGNGWYRCSLTVLATAANYFNQLYPAGNGTIFAWGAQLELGAYATSYIPTLGTSVTRVADAASKTGISSLIGQTAGTLFAEVDITNFDAAGIFLSISDATSSNRVQFYKFTDSKIYALRISATQSAFTEISTSALSIGIYKVAFAYSSGNSALFINGQQIGSNATQTFTFGAMGKINLGARYDDGQIINDRITQALLFKTRLSNTELAQLTTL